MRPLLRISSKAAAFAATLLLVSAACAADDKPAAPAAIPQIYKTTIMNGPVATVSYSVQNGSPHLQALVQSLQFTENELSVTNELQKLRLGMAVNEQTLDTVRTSQALGLGPISTPSFAAGCGSPESALKMALIPQLAQSATPAMAYQLINLREQVQAELLVEQMKAIAPQQAQPLPAPNALPMPQQALPPVVPNLQPAAPMGVPQAAATPPAPVVIVQQQQVAGQQAQTPPYAALQQQVLAYQQQVRQQMMGIPQLQAQWLALNGLRR